MDNFESAITSLINHTAEYTWLGSVGAQSVVTFHTKPSSTQLFPQNLSSENRQNRIFDHK